MNYAKYIHYLSLFQQKLTRGLFLSIIFTLISSTVIVADTVSFVSLVPSDELNILSRLNVRMYIDGNYVGLRYRQSQVFLERAGQDLFLGDLLLFAESEHDSRTIAQQINERLRLEYETGDLDSTALGSLRSQLRPEENIQPTIPQSQQLPPQYRGVPVLPESFFFGGNTPEINEVWEETGARAIDPAGTGQYFLLPVIVRYQYLGIQTYLGKRVHMVSAQYAMRHAGDSRIPIRIQGTNRLTITVPIDNPDQIFIRNELDETYQFESGKILELKGFDLTWINDASPNQRSQEEQEVIDRLMDQEIEDLEITESPLGLQLSLQNIRFVPDQAIILPEERFRLDLLADALKQLEGRRFLVRGHTADIGTMESQIDLSLERAKTVIDEMVSRGIPPGVFMYEGLGGSEPIGDNNTDEGRKLNRRVELIILD